MTILKEFALRLGYVVLDWYLALPWYFKLAIPAGLALAFFLAGVVAG